jgi:hypothetical protein
MKKKLHTSFLVGFLLLFPVLMTSAQQEYLVKVFPTSGTIYIINNIPVVHWITIMPNYSVMDEIHHRYIFQGMDTLMNRFLYSIDATSGAVISNPPFPALSDPADNIIELQFDNSNGNLYGLHWNNLEQREYFVSVDPATGAMTIIDSIPYVHYIATGPSYTTYDKNNHRYFFQGIDDFGGYHLYAINALTGQVLSSPTYQPSIGNVYELQYDISTNSMYGMYRDNVNHHIFLVNMDPITLATTIVDSISGLDNTCVSPHYVTFDQVNHHYIFLGMDHSWQKRLYTVDVNTGQVLSNPLFPVLLYSYENVIELEIDNATGEFFALHWGGDKLPTGINNTESNTDFKLFPNPFSDHCTLELGKSMNDVAIFVYDVNGKVVRTIKYSNASSIEIQRDGLPSGLYFISVNCGNINLGLRKIVID